MVLGAFRGGLNGIEMFKEYAYMYFFCFYVVFLSELVDE